MKTCESCGLPIPAERVAAVPEMELCVQCKTRLERKTAKLSILLKGSGRNWEMEALNDERRKERARQPLNDEACEERQRLNGEQQALEQNAWTPPRELLANLPIWGRHCACGWHSEITTLEAANTAVYQHALMHSRAGQECHIDDVDWQAVERGVRQAMADVAARDAKKAARWKIVKDVAKGFFVIVAAALIVLGFVFWRLLAMG